MIEDNDVARPDSELTRIIGKFIAKTIADYTAIAKADEQRKAEEKKKREEAALARKYKKELKDKESKRKMLEQLQAEAAEGKI